MNSSVFRKFSPLHPPLIGNKAIMTNTFLTMGGRIRCRQCKAQSKRTKQQCRAPALKGKEVCRTHGGLSTGPKTKEGRARCAAAKTVHGRETRAIRRVRSEKMAELYELELLARKIGMITGPKARGKKPKGWQVPPGTIY